MQNIILQSLNINDFKKIINDVLEEKFSIYKADEKRKENITYLSRNEVAKMLRISLATLHDWSKRCIIPSYRIGNRVLYKLEDVEKSLQEVSLYKYKRG